MESGCDPNGLMRFEGWEDLVTPLLIAVDLGKGTECTKILLANGADPYMGARKQMGSYLQMYTPTEYAFIRDKVSLRDVLLK